MQPGNKLHAPAGHVYCRNCNALTQQTICPICLQPSGKVGAKRKTKPKKSKRKRKGEPQGVKIRRDIHDLSPKLQRVYKRDQGVCHLCDLEVPIPDATLDHVDPKRFGGSNDEGNLKLAHEKCNIFRGTMEVDECRYLILGHA